MRQIGEKAGLQKASVYYYFAGKEDILRAMTDDIMKPSVRLLRALDASGLTAAARLHYFLFFDIRHICSAQYDYTWLLTTSETRSARFSEFWKDRERLLAWITKTIRAGIGSGQFRKTDITAASHALFALDEFTVTWSGSNRSMTAAQTAAFVADLAIRSILARPDAIGEARGELSGKFDLSLPPDGASRVPPECAEDVSHRLGVKRPPNRYRLPG